jgi:hypothetical protein
LEIHAYDEALAAQIYRHVVQEYVALFGQMAGTIQGLSWE